MAIRIIDVSAALKAGTENTFGRDATYKGIPTGGLYNLATHIANSFLNSDTIVLCWDERTNRRDFLPEYKSSRNPDNAQRFARKMSYEYLKRSVPNSFKQVGYEADDLAASLIHKYVNKEVCHSFDLYTTDYDWAHNIKNDFQRLVPLSKNVGLVQKGNFKDFFSVANCDVPFNSITAYKLFTGDTSDGVPVIKLDDTSPEKMFNDFIHFCDKNEFAYYDVDSMVSFIVEIEDKVSSEVFQEILNRCEVLYPRIIDLTLDFTPVDISMFKRYCSLIGARSVCKRLGIDMIEDMGEEQEAVKAMFENENIMRGTTHFSKANEGKALPERGGFY